MLKWHSDLLGKHTSSSHFGEITGVAPGGFREIGGSVFNRNALDCDLLGRITPSRNRFDGDRDAFFEYACRHSARVFTENSIAMKLTKLRVREIPVPGVMKVVVSYYGDQKKMGGASLDIVLWTSDTSANDPLDCGTSLGMIEAAQAYESTHAAVVDLALLGEVEKKWLNTLKGMSGDKLAFWLACGVLPDGTLRDGDFREDAVAQIVQRDAVLRSNIFAEHRRSCKAAYDDVLCHRPTLASPFEAFELKS